MLLGPKPEGSPSLADGPNAKAEIAKLAGDLWGKGDGTTQGHIFGKGKVYSGKTIEEVLAAEKEAPDFSWSAPENAGEDVPYPLPRGDSDEDLLFIHRQDGGRDIYFVSTQKHHSFDVKASFRATGKAPRLWDPATGEIEPANYTTEQGHTVVPLHLDAQGSVFVVFEGSGAPSSRSIPKQAPTKLASVDGSWKVAFPPNLGATDQVDFPALTSWTENSDAGVKYFSGTATYMKHIDAPQEWFKPDRKVMLDLGTVKEMAEVLVNGKPMGGVLWKPPFVVDVTGALRPGSNEISVKVTNLWPNRMIGDLQAGATKAYTWTDFRPFKADSPLLESGLLGPVMVWSAEKAKP